MKREKSTISSNPKINLKNNGEFTVISTTLSSFGFRFNPYEQ